MKYDFFVAGRWRNREPIESVVKTIRGNHKTAFCFLENTYSFDPTSDITESLPLDDPKIVEIFEKDISGQRLSDAFILVFPAGLAAHMEAGIAYGMGMKCYAIGMPEKTETLYRIFDRIFPDLASFEAWLVEQKQ